MVYDVVVEFLTSWIDAFGYVGIFFLMFLEGSFFPFPSEVVVIPAGYLAYQGKMNLGLVILIGILGAVAGSWLNYFLADRFGRKLLLRFLKERHLKRIEGFFERHGHISTFNGRLIPGLRQYISFPAGLAKMNRWKFTFYTGLGAGIWIVVLALLGFFLGANEDVMVENLRIVTMLVLNLVLGGSVVYVWFWKRKSKPKTL